MGLQRHQSVSTVALAVVLATLFCIIWSLPAPTFPSKIRLLRQSWHINEVLQEGPKLQKELASLHKEVEGLQAELGEVQASNSELQAKVTAAESESKATSSLLDEARSQAAVLKGESDGLA